MVWVSGSSEQEMRQMVLFRAPNCLVEICRQYNSFNMSADNPEILTVQHLSKIFPRLDFL